MSKGLFGTLFDFQFTSLLTTKIVKLLYALSMVVIALIVIVFVIVGFSMSATVGAVTLVIIAPLYAFASLVYTRVALEFVIALFRIMETTQQIAARNGEQAPVYSP